MSAELQNHELLMRLQRLEAQNARLLQRVSLLEDDDVLPWPKGGEAAAGITPLQKIFLDGVEGTITGSYSSATQFLWWNQANNTAEWKSGDLSPCPLDTKIRDGSKTQDAEWRDWR